MPDSLVIDATCAVLLVVPDPAQPRYEALVGGWKRAVYELYAPGLWIYEVTSALWEAVRFGGLTSGSGW
jgi:predicted nucleic acid-binding protein